jgi:hypothetical protein
MPWLVVWWWSWLCFEPVHSVLHVGVELLLLYCHLSPIFVVLWFWPPHDVGVHGIGQGTGEDVQYQLLVDIISCVTYQLFEFRNKRVEVLRSVGRSVRLGRWGVCPECRQGVERICHAITKQVQRSDARIEVDVMHTWNECTE